MPADVFVLACLPADYDAATHVCAAPFYTYPPSALPSLSIADAQAIGIQIAVVFAVAWGIRMCKRALNEIG
jgi:hypothetical protein